jgi:hypothetical protein
VLSGACLDTSSTASHRLPITLKILNMCVFNMVTTHLFCLFSSSCAIFSCLDTSVQFVLGLPETSIPWINEMHQTIPVALISPPTMHYSTQQLIGFPMVCIVLPDTANSVISMKLAHCDIPSCPSTSGLMVSITS